MFKLFGGDDNGAGCFALILIGVAIPAAGFVYWMV